MAWMLLAVLSAQMAEADHPPPAVSEVHHKNIASFDESVKHNISLSTSKQSIVGEKPELITVSWAGLPKDLAQEAWVGLYLVGETLTDVVPLKYQFCNHSTKTATTHSGNLIFEVLNYRNNVVFHLFTGWMQPRLLASEIVKILLPASPSGIHLALTGIAGEVAITWTSVPLGVDDENTSAEDAPRVEYDVFSSDHGAKRQTKLLRHGSSRFQSALTYRKLEMCGPPANAEGYRDPGTIYSATIRDLLAGNFVKYRVGRLGAWSSPAWFRAPPASNAAVRVLMFGDMGQRPPDHSRQAAGENWKIQDYSDGDPGALDTMSMLEKDHKSNPADMILHNGDLSYAMGYSGVWESFQTAIQPVAAAVPWMVTMGNHERDWPMSGSSEGDKDSLGECGVPAMRRFPTMPFVSRLPPPLDQPWWTLTLGVIRFIAVSTEHDISRGSPQHNFLLSSVSNVNRSETPWVVLVGHRPYQVSSNWPSDADFPARFRAAAGVAAEQTDLIIGAHHHSYQRTCPLKNDRCAAEGPVVVNVGIGGANLNAVNKSALPQFHYVDDQHFGYCRLVANARELYVEFVHNRDGEVHDRVVLRKGAVTYV